MDGNLVVVSSFLLSNHRIPCAEFLSGGCITLDSNMGNENI